MSAIRLENATAAASEMPNSPKTDPMFPGMKETGRITAIRTSVVAMTAKPISRPPFVAASRVGSPPSIRRAMFSSTTIASSTTSPIARTKPSSVSVLIEKSSAAMTMKAEMIEIGIVSAGMTVARSVPMKP